MTFLILLSSLAMGQTLLSPSHIQNEQAVSFCGLVAQPTEYANTVVTLPATLINGMEFNIITDDPCPAEENPRTGKSDVVEVTFKAGIYDSKSALHKKLMRILKHKREAQVTVIGMFIDPGRYIGHQLCCRYQLDIQKLISVKEISRTDRRNRLSP
jgi:hypothetical protein